MPLPVGFKSTTLTGSKTHAHLKIVSASAKSSLNVFTSSSLHNDFR